MCTQEIFKVCFVEYFVPIDGEMFEEHDITQEIFSPS